MRRLESSSALIHRMSNRLERLFTHIQIRINCAKGNVQKRLQLCNSESGERGDVPGWVLVVLMTTGLVTAIWTIAAPRLTAILRNSLDSMNGIR